MKPPVKVAFASGPDELNLRLIEQMRQLFPDLPLYVVSEFAPPDDPANPVRWVRYQPNRSLESFGRCRAAFRGKRIRLAGVLLVPGVPLRAMRLMAFALAPVNFIAFNEQLNHFMLRPRSIPAIAQHIVWRARNFLRWRFTREGRAASRDLAIRAAAAAAASRPAPPAIAHFPGRAASANPRVLIATPYLPFPLSHGGAVRMFNLMRRAAAEFDLIVVAFAENPEPPARELLEISVEIVTVSRTGSHALPSRGRPDVVEEFDSSAYRDALHEALRQWQPGIAQLEFTQMAQYARDCAPAKTILVEHDITFDLYAQLLGLDDDWDLRRQAKLWRRFETAAWRDMACVVTMSEKDRRAVSGARAVTLPNGVDLERFRPSAREPEARRLLFIGSFAHLPNLLAAAFFLDNVWPLLRDVRLHIVAGKNHEYFMERYRDRVTVNLAQPGVEIDGFVADVRPAYERAAVVVAPLVASAGTNIKILEAMACGKAIVSTPAGVNGLDVAPGGDFLLADTAGTMAEAIGVLLDRPEERRRIGEAARARVEREYNWDEIARKQAALYRELLLR